MQFDVEADEHVMDFVLFDAAAAPRSFDGAGRVKKPSDRELESEVAAGNLIRIRNEVSGRTLRVLLDEEPDVSTDARVREMKYPHPLRVTSGHVRAMDLAEFESGAGSDVHIQAALGDYDVTVLEIDWSVVYEARRREAGVSNDSLTDRMMGLGCLATPLVLVVSPLVFVFVPKDSRPLALLVGLLAVLGYWLVTMFPYNLPGPRERRRRFREFSERCEKEMPGYVAILKKRSTSIA